MVPANRGGMTMSTLIVIGVIALILFVLAAFGVAIPVVQIVPPGLAFFDFSGTRLLLEQNGPKATIYFRVDDIEAAYEELKANGLTFIGGPHLIFRDEAGTFGDAGEEEWMAFFTDPSGNTLALATRRRE